MTVTKGAPAPIPEMQLTGYASSVSLFATRYKQGGRTVYGLDLSPEQLVNLIPVPDPTVASPGNRRIRPQHAQDFARYFREHENWVVPALILRAPNIFKFEVSYEVEGTQFGVITFPRGESKDIHILDGQHRILGFHYASRQIADDLDKAQSALVTARRVDPQGAAVGMAQERISFFKAQRRRLEVERVSVDIIVEQDLKEFQQMFFDIADNALGITASVRSRFDTRKVANRALEPVLEHPLLFERVDVDSDRIGRGSPYLMGAKHATDLIRTVTVGIQGRISRVQEKEFKDAMLAKATKEFLDALVEGFTPLKAITLGQLLPDDLRKTSLLGSVNMLRALAGVYYELHQHAWTDEMIVGFFKLLSPHTSGPVYKGSIWLEHMPEQVFSDGAMAPHGRHQDMKALVMTMVDWAIENPAWLSEPPAPRPEPEPEPELDIEALTEEQADEVLRPETASARRMVKEKVRQKTSVKK